MNAGHVTLSHLDSPRVAPLGNQVVPPLMPVINCTLKSVALQLVLTAKARSDEYFNTFRVLQML